MYCAPGWDLPDKIGLRCHGSSGQVMANVLPLCRSGVFQFTLNLADYSGP